jgi:hypothetical protein
MDLRGEKQPDSRGQEKACAHTRGPGARLARRNHATVPVVNLFSSASKPAKIRNAPALSFPVAKF